MAIIARCRIPPESSCGYDFAIRSGFGMLTCRSMSTACSQARFLSGVWCSRIASWICAPIV